MKGGRGGSVLFFFPYTFLKKGERVGEMRLLVGGNILLCAGDNMVPEMSWNNGR